MKTVKLSSIYSRLKIMNDLPFIAGSIFIVLALVSAHLAVSHRYTPLEGRSSFTTVPPAPQDVERYFLTLLDEDLVSTASRSGFPSELLFLPDTKKTKQYVSEECLKRISQLAESGNWKACQEELSTLNGECRTAVAASFARRFADSGDFKVCEIFLQECREGFTFQELCDFNLQVVRAANCNDWRKGVMKSLQKNLVLPNDADEAMAIQYVIRVLFIARLMEEEGKSKEANSLYKNAVEKTEKWAGSALPVSWHYILPAFLHYRLWRNQERSGPSTDDTEKALAWMRGSVPVNRWTWRYHQAVRHYAQTRISARQTDSLK
jgi:hypothetical protein